VTLCRARIGSGRKEIWQVPNSAWTVRACSFLVFFGVCFLQKRFGNIRVLVCSHFLRFLSVQEFGVGWQGRKSGRYKVPISGHGMNNAMLMTAGGIQLSDHGLWVMFMTGLQWSDHAGAVMFAQHSKCHMMIMMLRPPYAPLFPINAATTPTPA